MVSAAKGPDLYGLAPRFERAVAALLCARPRFYGAVGKELEPARVSEPAAALCVLAAQQHAEETGKGPSAPVLVVQRVRRWVHEGKRTAAELESVVDLLDEELVAPPDESEVLVELVPVLQRLIQGETALAAIEAYKKGGASMDKVAEMIRRAETLGKRDRSTGARFGVAALKDLRSMRQAERLQTGVLELDMGLGGGLPRGKLGIVIAAAKAGKSMFLTGQAAFAMVNGFFVVEATLEMEEWEKNARLTAHLTDMPIDAVLDGAQEAEVQERMEDLLPRLGPYRVKRFPAKQTTMTDLAEWIKEVEQEEGRAVDLVVVDYVDKMGSTNKKHVSEYDVQGQAAEDFRLYVVDRALWGWTASQPKRRDAKDRGKRIEIDDMADSINKGRVADLVLGMTRPTEAEVELYVAGFRSGRDKFSVGPLPHNFACAQIVPAVAY